MNSILAGMIEAERQERIAADLDMMNRLNTLRTDITNQMREVDASIREINGSISKLSQSDASLGLQIKNLEQSTKLIEDAFELKLKETNTSLLEVIQGKKDELTSRLSLIDSKISEIRGNTDSNTREIIENREKILSAIELQRLFENHASQAFATKSDLAIQQELYRNLETIVRSLDVRLTRTSEEISQTLGQRIFEVTARVHSIETKVTSQGKDLDALRSDLSSAISEYREQHEELSLKLRDEIRIVQMSLGNMLIQQNQALRSELLLELNRQSLELTLYTNKAVSLLSNCLSELSKREDKNNAAQVLAISELRKDMVAAIAKEQRERKLLADDVESLIVRVLNVEQDVKDLQLMSTQTYNFLTRLTSDFEAEKVAVAKRFSQQAAVMDAKLQELRNDFEKRLSELGDFSESLVRNLGLEVQQNFRNVNLEIATLSNRQSNAEKRLEVFLEEYQRDRSKTSNFSARISGPFRQAQGHLSSTIDALTALQFRFIQVLAPDEDTPDFYNDDLRKALEKLNKNCGVEPGTKFVNIYGLDSFQLISIEYVRLLLSGLNSGKEKRDRIFHSYGRAGDSRLSQAVVMALLQTPANDSDKDCRNEVQQWARGIVLNDDRFSALADALAEDDELERRVSVLYENIQNTSQPLKEIEKQIEASVAGIRDRESVFDSMVAQTALDLVNAAWDSRQISDRLALVDNLESMQTTQGELAQEMKAGFAELRQRLKTFEEKTTQRLSRIEDQTGRMTLSLKRALDVLISLADRAGYADLRAYAQWAAEPIDYEPSIFPNWSPRVSAVQHFFSGNLSLRNKTAACTGSSILPRGGVQGMYQFGTWGPCFVNFRSFPVAAWGNEFQTLWLRVFGAGHVINLSVDPAIQRDNRQLFRNYNYNRTFDFRAQNPLLKLTGSFENGVFDIRVPDLLDFYLKNIRSFGGVTVSVQAIREDLIGAEAVRKISSVFNYTIQVFSPLIIDFHNIGLPRTLSFQESSVRMNFIDEKKFERTGWVKGSEAAFLLKRSLPVGTKIEKKHLFAEGEICQGQKSQTGFDALLCFDENGDGVIDGNDSRFKDLTAFFDYDADGVIDFGELQSLESRGLQSLETDYTTIAESEGLRQGNDLRYVSNALGSKGMAKAKIIDVYFGVEK